MLANLMQEAVLVDDLRHAHGRQQHIHEAINVGHVEVPLQCLQVGLEALVRRHLETLLKLLLHESEDDLVGVGQVLFS